MRPQDNAVLWINKSVADLCRAASEVPEDVIDWSPHAASSILRHMQETAVSHEWFLSIIRSQSFPADLSHYTEVPPKHQTVAECVEAIRRGAAELCQAVYDLSIEELEVEVILPESDGGMLRILDVIWSYTRNLIYHLGQINLIQEMSSDRVPG